MGNKIGDYVNELERELNRIHKVKNIAERIANNMRSVKYKSEFIRQTNNSQDLQVEVFGRETLDDSYGVNAGAIANDPVYNIIMDVYKGVDNGSIKGDNLSTLGLDTHAIKLMSRTMDEGTYNSILNGEDESMNAILAYQTV